MITFRNLCCQLAAVALIGVATPLVSMQYPRPDPKVMSYTLPNKITWTVNHEGARVAVLYGNPAKPGWYVMLVKWEPHMMSPPHYHLHDQYITVLKGTWWAGWGTQFNTKRVFPMPAGSYVVHYGHEPHYDGAKNGEVILEIVGEGPATAVLIQAK